MCVKERKRFFQIFHEFFFRKMLQINTFAKENPIEFALSIWKLIQGLGWSTKDISVIIKNNYIKIPQIAILTGEKHLGPYLFFYLDVVLAYLKNAMDISNWYWWSFSFILKISLLCWSNFSQNVYKFFSPYEDKHYSY